MFRFNFFHVCIKYLSEIKVDTVSCKRSFYINQVSRSAFVSNKFHSTKADNDRLSINFVICKKILRWWREFYVREAPCRSLQYDRLTARHRLHQPGQSQYRMWGVPTRWQQWSVPTPRAEAPHPTTGGRELSVANQSGPISGELPNYA